MMMEHTIAFEQAHKENYLQAVKELIENNTTALIQDDIMPLFNKPPLDSMDLIRSKFLSLAKEQKIVIDSQTFNQLLETYQQEMQEAMQKIGKIRVDNLFGLLKSFEEDKEESIKILKKDLIQIDKRLQKEVKQTLEEKSTTILLHNLASVFPIKEEALGALEKQMKEFIKKKYCKQILESLDIKILVKDTTFLNGLKEQTNRYLFTLENSHLFD